MSSLQELEISECNGLKELHESLRQLKQLQSLTLSSCKSIKTLPYWLGQLTSLKKIKIQKCYGIKYAPEGFKKLTSEDDEQEDLGSMGPLVTAYPWGEHVLIRCFSQTELCEPLSPPYYGPPSPQWTMDRHYVNDDYGWTEWENGQRTTCRMVDIPLTGRDIQRT